MKYVFVLISFVLGLTACAPSATLSPTAAPASTVIPTAATALVQPTPTQETLGQPVAQSGPDAGGVVRPAWQTLPVVNARTGETFTFADLAGKLIFVEPMATWCTNCRQQLGNVKVASGQVSGDKVVFVALSVETDLTADTLAQYAETNDFDWIFAVATPELLGELVNTFGRAITAPPSTPHFIIRSDGTTTALVTGIETPDQLVQHLQAEAGG